METLSFLGTLRFMFDQMKLMCSQLDSPKEDIAFAIREPSIHV